eukprot:PhF_6_TR10820/c0_g1_i2/m.17443
MGVDDKPKRKLKPAEIMSFNRRMHDDQVKLRAKARNKAIQEATRSQTSKEIVSLSEEELNAHIQRLHDSAIRKQQSTASALTKKFIEEPMKQWKSISLQPDQLGTIVQGLYSTSVKNRQASRAKLEEKYLTEPKMKKMTTDEIKSAVLRLYETKKA